MDQALCDSHIIYCCKTIRDCGVEHNSELNLHKNLALYLTNLDKFEDDVMIKSVSVE